MENTFKYYKRLKSQIDSWERSRGSVFGIAVQNDEYAIKWQGKKMSLEILEAKLEGRYPNWHNARYLTAEEASKRNESYYTKSLTIQTK